MGRRLRAFVRAVDLHYCSAYVQSYRNNYSALNSSKKAENGILSGPYGPKAKVKPPHVSPLLAFEWQTELVDRFERISNRIVLGVIAAAFINGQAVLMSVYRRPGWEHWAWAVVAFGFLCALVPGIYLAWRMLRFTRH